MTQIFGSRFFCLLAVLILLLTVTSCSKDEIEIKKERISGFVQKGPFINGTQILMTELNAALEQTGKVFSTQIVSNTGEFEIADIALSSQYVEFSASGFYFDEVKGESSSAQLTLFALSDITDITSVNVNILTHLEKGRVEFLIAQGTSFAEAKTLAQSEIFAMFGFDNSGVHNSEILNIVNDDDGNAMLLAMSVILQGNRSVADLTELLAMISGDLKEDGLLNSETIIENLRLSTMQIDLAEVRSNLIDRYQTLGLNVTIPDFETYVNVFLSHTPENPLAVTLEAKDITLTEANLTGRVKPNSALTKITFEYSTSMDFALNTNFAQLEILGHDWIPVEIKIENLSPGTLYYYRVKAENEKGNSFGQGVQFQTLGDKPKATVFPPKQLTNEAKLSGIVKTYSLETEIFFEWGQSNSFDHSTIGNVGSSSGIDEYEIIADIAGLSANTVYNLRIKATNILGTSYSEAITFTTYNSIVSDVEGNIYPTVIIGEQEWMAKNLITTRYNNGDLIPTGLSDTEWKKSTQGAYSIYPYNMVEGINSESEMVEAYGILYNGYAGLDTRELCPIGWRVPEIQDYIQLVCLLDPDCRHEEEEGHYLSSIGGEMLATTNVKPMPHPRWFHPSNATNQTNFSAIPSGYRSLEGFYADLQIHTALMTKIIDSNLDETINCVSLGGFGINQSLSIGFGTESGTEKRPGYSVRCIKE